MPFLQRQAAASIALHSSSLVHLKLLQSRAEHCMSLLEEYSLPEWFYSAEGIMKIKWHIVGMHVTPTSSPPSTPSPNINGTHAISCDTWTNEVTITGCLLKTADLCLVPLQCAISSWQSINENLIWLVRRCKKTVQCECTLLPGEGFMKGCKYRMW